MAISGGLAAAGLWSDAAIPVIGAMIIAPGFEPLLRAPFGALIGPRYHAGEGLIALLAGYAVLAASAALVTLALAWADPAGATTLTEREWVRFWVSLTPVGVVVTIVAASGGIFTVIADRPVLTAGVMVALSLIPAAAVTGMALAAGDYALGVASAGRWLVDVVGVSVVASFVIVLKRKLLHKRSALG